MSVLVRFCRFGRVLRLQPSILFDVGHLHDPRLPQRNAPPGLPSQNIDMQNHRIHDVNRWIRRATGLITNGKPLT